MRGFTTESSQIKGPADNTNEAPAGEHCARIHGLHSPQVEELRCRRPASSARRSCRGPAGIARQSEAPPVTDPTADTLRYFSWLTSGLDADRM
jgi:hypothetical protein